MKVIKAIYNFFVGDMIILIGVAITIVLLTLINNVGPLEPARGVSAVILVLGVLISLVVTLVREVQW